MVSLNAIARTAFTPH